MLAHNQGGLLNTTALARNMGVDVKTASGYIDLLLVFPDGDKWAIEVKRSLSPKPGKGFYYSCDDIQPVKKFIVYPGREKYPIGTDIQVISPSDLCDELTNSM